MIGEIVPLVMIPRFTSYLGEGTYTTVPLDVSDYEGATLEFWRGQLRSPGTGTFTAYFEQASEPWADDTLWNVLATVTSANASSLETLTFSRFPYFRVRIVLEDATYHAVGVTCWAAGFLRKRDHGGAAA